MGIKLPQYTIEEFKQQPSFWKRLLFPILVILSFAVGYNLHAIMSDNSTSQLSERNIILEENNNKSEDEILHLQAEIQHLKTEQQVKQEALIKLQMDYRDAIDGQNVLKSEINFYERLLSPNDENKGLRVFDTSVSQLTNDSYKLKVTLVQKLERANIISGKLEVQLTGTVNGKTQNIKINENQDSDFNFKYFHHLYYTFSMPSGFKARELVVKLSPRKSKNIEYKVDWNSMKITGAN